MRELTGSTRIRIKRPRPELTGDTRIRLSQVKDLKEWVLEMAQDEAAPEGTVHHWSDGDHIKKNGKWVPVQNKKEITMSMGPGPVKEKAYIQNFINKYNKGIYPETIEGFAKITKSEIYKPGSNKLTKDQESLINNGIKTLKQLTGSSFDNILIIRNPKLVNQSTVAQMHPKYPGTIMISINHQFWNNAELRKKYLEQTSTGNPAHPFLHEEGHRKTKVKIKEWQGIDCAKAFFSLGVIAMQSPEEFCAEYYAAKVTNSIKDPARLKDAEALYNKYGGKA